MAIERNPNELIPETNVIPIRQEESTEENVSFDVNPDGSVVVNFSEETERLGGSSVTSDWYGNLVEDVDDELLKKIAGEVFERYEADKDSRQEWESMFERGFDLLGLKLQDASEPFQGACSAVHPLLIESAVKFQSKASQELFPPAGPVKAQVIGKYTPEKDKQADRVQMFMNYQLTEQMPEYFDEFERMLFHLPLMGSAFKKVYYDASLSRPVSEFVPIDQFYVSSYASDLRKADRYTHVIYRTPHDLARQIASGMYLDVDLEDATTPTQAPITNKMDTIMGLNPSGDSDPQYVLLEQHCYLELPEELNNGEVEGVPLPYIVTVEEQSRKVLSIRRNYKPDDPRREKILHFVHYRFVPGFSFYGLGLIHFLGNLTMTASAAMRALVDAGQFANLPGGYKAKGVRIVGDNDPISPGEFKEVEATGMDLTKAIMTLPYKEPSQTLYNMLQFVATAGQKFADSTEQVISDMSSYGPVGTTMALLEASSKFFSAIHKRVHKTQKDEFKIIARINHDFLPDEYPFDIPGESQNVLKSDFDGRVDIIPVSDPNVPSSAHRLMISQMALQLAQQAPPGMFNLEALNRTILENANMPNIEQILPEKRKAEAMDPISDIVAATKGVPIAAFPGQNHEAHVKIKTAYLQDPIHGANPMMQRVKPIIEANIQEHAVMKYQEQVGGVAQQVLSQLPPEQAQMPEAPELAMAQAAEQVLNANRAMGVQMSPEQQMVKIEQARLQLEQQKLQIQVQTEAAEAALKNRELDLEELEIGIKAGQKQSDVMSKAEQKERDRISKQAMRAVEMLYDASMKGAELDSDMQLKSMDVLTKLAELEQKSEDVNTMTTAKKVLGIAQLAEKEGKNRVEALLKISDLLAKN